MLRLCYLLLLFCFSSLLALPTLGSLNPNANITLSLQTQPYSNTNTISTLEWNQRENKREALRGSGVLREGNEYNSRAYLGEWRGSGERDNLAPLVGIAVRVAIATGSWVAKKAIKSFTKSAVKKEAKEGGKKVAEKGINPKGRNSNKLKPNPEAKGNHTEIKRARKDDPTSPITNYATYKVDPKRPSGFQQTKRVD